MTRLQLIIGVLVTLAATIGGGVIHGRLSDRWGASAAVQEAASALEALPEEFGAWRMSENSQLDQASLDELQPYGYVNRTYLNMATGQQVNFFVLMGPVGPTAVHTPEVCYSARNYAITQPAEVTEVRAGDRRLDEFWAMTFQANSLDGGLLRVYYGWSNGTRWEAVSDARFNFAGLPYLYKTQLAAYLPPGADLENEDACRQFLMDLLPVLRGHMVPAASR